MVADSADYEKHGCVRNENNPPEDGLLPTALLLGSGLCCSSPRASSCPLASAALFLVWIP